MPEVKAAALDCPPIGSGTRIVVRFASYVIIAFMALPVLTDPARMAVIPDKAPNAPIPLTFFGMHVGVHTPYSTPILAPITVGAVGKGVITFWPYTETARGVYSSWGPVDKEVEFGTRHNAPVYKGNAYEPEWAVSDTSHCRKSALPDVQFCSDAPSDITTVAACQSPLQGMVTTDCMWKEYVTTLVNRYKSTGIQTGCGPEHPQCHGVIEMYEGWNEPNGSSGGNMANFVKLQADFLDTVKANDPRAKVCSPAFIITSGAHATFYTTLMNSFFASGGPKNFDCYDFHINEPTPEAQISDIKGFKDILRRNGIDPQTATIYATEAGRWGGCDASIPDAEQQAYVARILLLYWSNGVKRLYWYAYDTCGTLTNQPADSSLKPVGIAYGNVEKWMLGATMTIPCSATRTIWTCGLTRPNGSAALAVWDTASNSEFSVPAEYKQYQDLEGGWHSVNGPVNIGPQPILLTSQGPTLE
jgi:hypothetical protein